MLNIETLLENLTLTSRFCESDFRSFCDYYLDSHDFFYDSGATKGVIIPKDQNYVIKIPFHGSFEEEYDENDEWTEIFYPFCGANSYLSCQDWDYCLKEVEIYEKAIEAGVEEAFAQTLFYDEIKNYPIYTQEKITNTYNEKYHWNRKPEEDQEKTLKTAELAKTIGIKNFNFTWLSDVMDYFGENFVIKLLKFIQQEEIHDLHGDNLGYIYDRPVILDYAGYRE